MRENIDKFIAGLQESLQNSTFVKLTLANYKGSEEHLQRISVRVVATKKGKLLAFQTRFATRDVVTNFDIEPGIGQVRTHLENGFRSAHLFTTENDFQLTIGKKSARLIKTKPTFHNKPSVSHDREKKHLIDPNAYYLKALGITTDEGRIRSDQRDKWTQINKFVEIVAGLIENSSLKDKPDLHIVDMGSGKGYLTFALYDFLMQKPARSKGEISIQLTGVEQRPDLVSLCKEIAQASSFDGLKFVQGTIADFDLGETDILIALHACDTATDDALYKGITANAEIIVAAPCCHHELKKQLKLPDLLAGILKHPVMLERTAETITDGIRSLLLESKGYKTKMFEFVATEHTPKNNLLVATRISSPKGSAEDKRVEIAAITDEFGIEHQRLADLLDRKQ
ncbi:MAG: class I SAM-dependent methyltransferase [Pyrinomonadaceae bacterium]